MGISNSSNFFNIFLFILFSEILLSHSMLFFDEFSVIIKTLILLISILFKDNSISSNISLFKSIELSGYIIVKIPIDFSSLYIML